MPVIVVLTAIVSGAFGFYASADSTLIGTETSSIMGHVTLTLYDADGNIKDYVQTDNLVVDDGFDTIADIVHGEPTGSTSGGGTSCNSNGCNGSASDTPFQYLEIGTATAAVGATDTVLGASACARQQDATPLGDSDLTGETEIELEQTFSGATCAGDITEAGVFNASSGEEMLAHQTFSAITVGASDSLTVTWTIKYS